MPKPKTPSPPYFSRRLSELRAARGLTLYRLAQMTGITDQALGGLEKGARPSFATAILVARALGVPLEDLADPDLLPREK